MDEALTESLLYSDVPNQTFPCIRGVQAKREFYITMVPLRLVPRVFLFDESEVPPELRSQRKINKARIPEMARYLVNNPNDYVFSAVTASVDGDVEFFPFGKEKDSFKMGHLIVPMTAKFIINDGQHRRAAIEEALKVRPDLGYETIPVVLFVDAGLKRSQQMFSDLNQHAVRPSRSLGILYDQRNDFARFVIDICESVDIFKGMVEKEKTSVSNRSPKLFTLSTIYSATTALLGKNVKKDNLTKDDKKLAIAFWNEVLKNMNEWQALLEKRRTCVELRNDYVHSHGIILHAIGIAGNTLVQQQPRTWKMKLKVFQKIDWSRSNAKVWEGRAMIGGRLTKVQNNVLLTANYLKKSMGLSLSRKEEDLEKKYLRGKEHVR